MGQLGHLLRALFSFDRSRRKERKTPNELSDIPME